MGTSARVFGPAAVAGATEQVWEGEECCDLTVTE